MIEFRYYGDAVGKARPRYSRRGDYVHTYTPRNTQVFEQAIQYHCKTACRKDFPKYDRDTPVKVSVTIAVGIPKSWSKKKREQAIENEILPTKKPDLDNVLKSLFDAMNGFAYEDDAQIVEIYAERFYTGGEPYIDVKVEEHKL